MDDEIDISSHYPIKIDLNVVHCIYVGGQDMMTVARYHSIQADPNKPLWARSAPPVHQLNTKHSASSWIEIRHQDAYEAQMMALLGLD
jgi:hypothetical protein